MICKRHVAVTFFTLVLSWQMTIAAVPMPDYLTPTIGIIFTPFDGLLVDTQVISFAAWRSVLAAYSNFDLSYEVYKRVAGLPAQRLLETLVDRYDMPVCMYSVTVDNYYAEFKKLLCLVGQPVCKPMMQAFAQLWQQKKNLKLRFGTLGQGSKRFMNKRLKQLGLERSFDAVMTDNNGILPMTDGIRIRLEFLRQQVGTKPEHTLVVTNDRETVLAARKNGMVVALFPEIANSENSYDERIRIYNMGNLVYDDIRDCILDIWQTEEMRLTLEQNTQKLTFFHNVALGMQFSDDDGDY